MLKEEARVCRVRFNKPLEEGDYLKKVQDEQGYLVLFLSKNSVCTGRLMWVLYREIGNIGRVVFEEDWEHIEYVGEVI